MPFVWLDCGKGVLVPDAIIKQSKKPDGALLSAPIMDYLYTHNREAYEAELAWEIKNSKLYTAPAESKPYEYDGDFD